jgi:hypothetical protein
MDAYRSQYSSSPNPSLNGFSPTHGHGYKQPNAPFPHSPSPHNFSPLEMPRPHTPTFPVVAIDNCGGTHAPTRPKRLRTFAQWVAAAKENTHEIEQHGSPVPLVWVLVEGKDIPANAIVGGEDRRKPLYIARSFYEGGIYIGKAGHHLNLGAAIPYNGREIEVSTYEVLVPALQPMRYALCDTFRLPEIPRMARQPNVEGLHRLNEIKTVVLIDDSMSMAGTLWAEAREALAGVADLNSKFSTGGVDVYFLNNTQFALDVKDGSAVRQLFDSVDPVGQTPTGEKLQEIFDRYIPLLEDKCLAHKPITIVVITDGVPTDDPESVIVGAARRLDQAGVPMRQIGVQFAQIGDDEDATEALRELDEGLADLHGIRAGHGRHDTV